MRYVYQTYTSAYLFDTRVTGLGHIGCSVRSVVGFSFKSQNISDKSLTLVDKRLKLVNSKHVYYLLLLTSKQLLFKGSSLGSNMVKVTPLELTRRSERDLSLTMMGTLFSHGSHRHKF